MNGRLFVLDGPDCVGKSTLARALAARIDAMYVNLSGNRKFWPVMWDYHNAMWDVVTDNICLGHSVVMDRFWMSEVVYHDVLRPDLDRFYNAPMLEMMVRGFNGLNILCHAGNERAAMERHRMHRDPTHPYNDLTYLQICGEYKTLFEAFKEKHTIDVFDYSIEAYQNKVDTAINEILAYDNSRRTVAATPTSGT